MSKTTEWRKKNPAKAKAAQDAYKEIQKKANKAYFSSEKAKATRALYAQKYKERRAELRSEKKELLRQKSKEWRALNPEKSRDSVRKYQLKNPEIGRIGCHNRRARIALSGGRLSRNIAERLLSLQKGKCACCKEKLTEYHIDHIKPIASGGENVDSNVQLLCPPCNHSKSSRNPVEFMQSRGFLL